MHPWSTLSHLCAVVGNDLLCWAHREHCCPCCQDRAGLSPHDPALSVPAADHKPQTRLSKTQITPCGSLSQTRPLFFAARGPRCSRGLCCCAQKCRPWFAVNTAVRCSAVRTGGGFCVWSALIKGGFVFLFTKNCLAFCDLFDIKVERCSKIMIILYKGPTWWHCL